MGQLQVVVYRSFALRDITEAHRYSESGRAQGKISLELLEQ